MMPWVRKEGRVSLPLRPIEEPGLVGRVCEGLGRGMNPGTGGGGEEIRFLCIRKNPWGGLPAVMLQREAHRQQTLPDRKGRVPEAGLRFLPCGLSGAKQGSYL